MGDDGTGYVEVIFRGAEVEGGLVVVVFWWGRELLAVWVFLRCGSGRGGGESEGALLRVGSAPLRKRRVTSSSPSRRLAAIIRGVHPEPS